jgi:hypothetical protein
MIGQIVISRSGPMLARPGSSPTLVPPLLLHILAAIDGRIVEESLVMRVCSSDRLNFGIFAKSADGE